MTSLPYARTKRQYALPQTPPNSPRMAPRMSVLALYSVIGLYALSFVVWGLSLSGAFLSSLSTSHHGRFKGRQRAAIDQDDMKMALDRRYLLDTGNRPPNLRCIGWKQTDSCDLQPSEAATKNRGCDQFVRGGLGGYCLMEDEVTGREIQTMHTSCDSLHPSVVLSCRHAGDFVDFQWEVAKLIATIEHEKESRSKNSALTRTGHSKGIVMVVYPKLLVSAYASIRALRALNCTLLVELWYIKSEMDIDDKISLLNDIPKNLQEEYGPLTLHQITDARVKGYNSKVWAITQTGLEHVLFLDADNVPIRDPSYLFEIPEFKHTGAVFWPDYWHPAHTIFNINENSLIWELLNLPFTDMFEQESGQLMIDKTKSSAALRMLILLTFHDPNLFSRYKLVHGDKDLFRLAWLKTKSAFHMIAYPPGLAGTVRRSKFCGMSMVQYDTTGEALFLHRNVKKLTGGLGANYKPDEQVWTHLQRFQYRAPSLQARATAKTQELSDAFSDSSHVPLGISNMPYELLRLNYSIQIFNGAPEFEKTQWCYGQSKITAPKYTTISWNESALPVVEKVLLQYANEAVALLSTVAVEHIKQSNRQEAN